MQNNIDTYFNLPKEKEKNTILGVVLTIFMGPFGFLYISFNAFIIALIVFFAFLVLPLVTLFVWFVLFPLSVCILIKRNNKLIHSGVPCESLLLKQYNPKDKIEEIKTKNEYEWFKEIEMLGPFSRFFSGVFTKRRELHFIGLTTHGNLHVGLYSGKEYLFNNYLAKYYLLDGRMLTFNISSLNGDLPDCRFVGHWFQDDAVWNEIKSKINAVESKTVFQKIGSGVANLLSTKCPKCNEKGHVHSTRISKNYIDKVYEESGSSQLSNGLRGLGGPTMGSNNSTKREFAWYLIYNATDSHSCKKCGHAWQTQEKIKEKA